MGSDLEKEKATTPPCYSSMQEYCMEDAWM